MAEPFDTIIRQVEAGLLSAEDAINAIGVKASRPRGRPPKPKPNTLRRLVGVEYKLRKQRKATPDNMEIGRLYAEYRAEGKTQRRAIQLINKKRPRRVGQVYVNKCHQVYKQQLRLNAFIDCHYRIHHQPPPPEAIAAFYELENALLVLRQRLGIVIELTETPVWVNPDPNLRRN